MCFPSLEAPFPDFSICFSGVFTMECGCDSVCERFRPTRLHRWGGVILFVCFFCLEGGIGDVVRNSNRMESVNSNAVTPAFSPETFINHGGQSSPTTQKLKNNSFVFWNFLGPLVNLFNYWIWMAYPVANWVGNSSASFDWRYWSFLVGVACQFLSTILTFWPTWSRIRDGLFVEEASKWVTWAKTMLNIESR